MNGSGDEVLDRRDRQRRAEDRFGDRMNVLDPHWFRCHPQNVDDEPLDALPKPGASLGSPPECGSAIESRAQRNGGFETPSCLQIANAVPVAMSVWRGTVATPRADIQTS